MDARFPKDTYVNDDRLGLGSAPAQVDIGGNWLPRVAPFIFNYTLSQMIFTDAGAFDWVIQGQTHGPMFFTAFNGNGSRFAKRGPGWGVDPVSGASTPIEADTSQCTAATMSACQQYGVIKSDLARLDDRQKTYTTFNLGLGWKRPDNMMSVRLFVNNVFNTTYATSITSQGTNNIRFFNDPRMVGVRVRFDL
jgi:hypothetical protein